MKVVINRSFGGFGLSDECCEALGGTKKVADHNFSYYILPDLICPIGDYNYITLRTNPRLIKLMETKGSEWCSGRFAELKIVEIPDDIAWEITEYDGMEQIEEVHRIWH